MGLSNKVRRQNPRTLKAARPMTRPSETSDLLTFVVPTHQRPGFLRRLLTFYDRVGFSHRLFIADSSEPAIHRQNLMTAAAFAGRLDIELRHYRLGVTEKCSAAMDQVRTPFVVFSADDDFQMPAAVGRCAEFLAAHDDFEACSGTSVFAVADQKKAVVRSYLSLLHNDLRRRLYQASTGRYFCLFYGVLRTAGAAERLKLAGDATDSDAARILSEAMILQMLAIDGKAMQLPEISYLREGHAGNFSDVAAAVQKPEAFPQQYERYCQPLLRRLQAAGLSKSQADQLIEQSFLDLVPGCSELVKGRQSGIATTLRHFGRFQRRLRSTGIRRAGRKRAVALSEIASGNPELSVAVEMLQQPVEHWNAVAAGRAA